MAEIIWSPNSIADIENIAEYIGKDSLQKANAMVELFFEKAAVLEKQLHIGKKVPESKVGIVTIHNQSRLLKNNPVYNKIRRRKK